jgi:hypothetical protein
VDLLTIINPPEVIAARTTAIHGATLKESRCIRQPNFQRIDTDDLAWLFQLYDREFFGGWLAPAVKAATPIPTGSKLFSESTSMNSSTLPSSWSGTNQAAQASGSRSWPGASSVTRTPSTPS